MARPWLDAYPPGVPASYRYPEVPLTRFLDDAARDFPHVVATDLDGATLDYAGLEELVARTAAALADLAVGVGTKVALALPNLPPAVAVAFATWRVGAVLVPIEPWLPVTEVCRILADADVEVLVTTPELATAVQEHGRPPALREVVTTRPQVWADGRTRLARLARRARPPRDVAPDGAQALADLLAATTRRVTQAPVGPADLAVIAYTGGTTGTRRGVMLTHGNLVANTFQARLWVPDVQAGRERVLAATPFTHVYGLTTGMLVAALAAATLVLVPDPTPDALVTAISERRPTLFPAVPALLRLVVEHPAAARVDLTSLRAGVSGAAPLSPDVARRFQELTGHARVREGYGLSEAGPLTHANPIYGRSVEGRIGLPVTDTVAIVVDASDPTRVLGPGEIGELAIAGPQVMSGYWRDPEATAEIMRGPWLLTGDLAVVDQSGSFALVDRKKDVIVTSIAAVFPREVEAVLESHPAVFAAAVVGRPTADGSDEVLAHVVLRPRAKATTEELVTHCRRHLPGPSVPVAVELRDELPRTRIGKLLRRELRRDEPGAAPSTGNGAAAASGEQEVTG